jgi:hypothetical protein
MKRADKSAMAESNFSEFISELSEDETLDVHAMRCVRGGDGDGGTGVPIFPPPPPK